MKAYKGFDVEPDGTLNCRGFQYAEGETYETDSAVLCETGFHACLEPMDVLDYYHPSTGAVIHEVEVADDAVGHEPHELKDSKVASTRITIGARIDIMGMVKVHLGPVWDRVAKVRAAKPDQYTSGDRSTAATSGDRSTAATSGYRSTAATSGDQSTAATSGDQSTAATSGYRSTAATSGHQSTAATSGNLSTAATSGRRSTAATSGYRSTAATSGYRSTAATSGDQSTVTVQGEESIALAGGWKCSASGAAGCWLVLAERDDDGHILGVQAVKVGSLVLGELIEPGVSYGLIDGFVMPVGVDGEALA